jgi:hypothetical protein
VSCIKRSRVDEDERTHVETNSTESTLATGNEAKSRRTQAWGFGLALLALVGVGTAAGGAVFAQDATSTPSTTLQEATPAAGSSMSDDATEENERNAFLDAFAAQLGVTDDATVDAAVQAALGQLVDERVAAGELTEAEAAVIKERIASGEYLVRVGVGGRDHDGDRGGRFGGDDRDNDIDDDKGADDATVPAADSTPAAATGVSA